MVKGKDLKNEIINIQLKGKQYSLNFDLNAMAELEEKYGSLNIAIGELKKKKRLYLKPCRKNGDSFPWSKLLCISQAPESRFFAKKWLAAMGFCAMPQAARRNAREWLCTASTSAETCSGGVYWLMP